MKDMLGMMKQIQGLQSKLSQVKDEVEGMEVSGASGGGLVFVCASGQERERRAGREEPGWVWSAAGRGSAARNAPTLSERGCLAVQAANGAAAASEDSERAIFFACALKHTPPGRRFSRTHAPLRQSDRPRP